MRVNTEQASKAKTAGADLPFVEGRPPSTRVAANAAGTECAWIDPAGVLVRACGQEEIRRNTGSPDGEGVCPSTTGPRGSEVGRLRDDGKARSTVEAANPRGGKGP